MWSRLSTNRFIYSFPIQLLMVLIKKNHVLAMYWLVLFGFVTGWLSPRFGIPYLFLDPEYIGAVGFQSFIIMGFATGCFIMVYNISSYIINGFRFPFIATLSRPFMKFTINNFIVPVAFILTYLYKIFSFQLYNEFQSVSAVIFDCVGFLLGLLVSILVTLTYFFRTNKDIIKMFGMEASDTNPEAPYAEHLEKENTEKASRKFSFRMKYAKQWRVDTYLSAPFKVNLVRRTDHYKKEMLESVFRQNHLNAAIVEIIVFVLFIVMGLFKDQPAFKIPAGASIILIFSMFLMLSSAFRFWLKSWSATAFIFLLLLFNFLSRYGIFYPENRAFGLQYNEKKASYTLASLALLNDSLSAAADYDNTIKILERWRSKFKEKPPLIFINCSGGGLRATMWAFRVMQAADSATGDRFMKHTELITGASGGMIGSAYYRELYLKQQLGFIKNCRDNAYLYNISKDLLNPVAFSMSVSDLFMNVRKFKEEGSVYTKDRGYAFEKQLNENSHFVFSKRITDYKLPEEKAIIPLMIFSPTIVTDGRRLIVSPQPVSYLTYQAATSEFDFVPTLDGIEFGKLFKEQNAGNMKFTSLLRMNSTFPYILPAVTLPSEPSTLVMDAGIRDNTGLKSTLKFLYVFREWLAENTSHVIVLDIRDSHRMRPMEEKPRMTFFENFITPLGNIYGNLLTIQDYNQEESFQYAESWYKGPLDYITVELPTKEQEISLSWHLTTREKKSIYNSIYLPQNVEALSKLKSILGNE